MAGTEDTSMTETSQVTVTRSGALWHVKVMAADLTYRTARTVATEVKALMQERFGELLLLDLGVVTYLDSVGMGILLEIQNTARQQKLNYWVRVTTELYRPLEKVRLARIIDLEVADPAGYSFVPEGRRAGRRAGRDRRISERKYAGVERRKGAERRKSPPRRDSSSSR